MLEDSIKTIQDLYKSFPNLIGIDIDQENVYFHIKDLKGPEDRQQEYFKFTKKDTVKALQWLEEKHGIKSD